MTGVVFPPGFTLEPLQKTDPRHLSDCGQPEVNHWLHTKALQHQAKRLSATRVLVDPNRAVTGFYTLATGQVDFSDLPIDLARKLPRRALPVAVLAWLGVSQARQGKKLGNRLLAQALRDCHEAGQTFAFVAVILDCVDERAKAFYQRWNFAEMPGQPYRLFLSLQTLASLMDGG
ncbi:MAG: GNAT family N-acetyltransferase [Planctomycetaceae bacterium]